MPIVDRAGYKRQWGHKAFSIGQISPLGEIVL